MNNAAPSEVQEFYSSLFYLYLSSGDSKATAESVRSLKFLAVMKDTIKKGNSNNVNIVKMREIMDKWLQQGSNTFRVTKREGTQNSYRKAVFFYFILCVTNTR